MLPVIRDIRLLLFSLWLGGAVFFSAVVAPAVFSVLRAYQISNATEIAGTIVNRTLGVVNITGFVISLFVLISAFMFMEGQQKRWLNLEILSVAVVAIATGLGQWVIAAKMHAIRTMIALPMDQLPTSDPRRVEFNQLHGYSVTALTIAMIAGLIAFFVMSHRGRLTSREGRA
jgi:Domain of unknown function (DUF4149)